VQNLASYKVYIITANVYKINRQQVRIFYVVNNINTNIIGLFIFNRQTVWESTQLNFANRKWYNIIRNGSVGWLEFITAVIAYFLQWAICTQNFFWNWIFHITSLFVGVTREALRVILVPTLYYNVVCDIYVLCELINVWVCSLPENGNGSEVRVFFPCQN